MLTQDRCRLQEIQLRAARGGHGACPLPSRTCQRLPGTSHTAPSPMPTPQMGTLGLGGVTAQPRLLSEGVAGWARDMPRHRSGRPTGEQWGHRSQVGRAEEGKPGLDLTSGELLSTSPAPLGRGGASETWESFSSSSSWMGDDGDRRVLGAEKMGVEDKWMRNNNRPPEANTARG